MTGPNISTSDIVVALDEATGSLAAARFLPSEAQEGAEWAIYALERLPEEIRDRFAGCIGCARATASAIVADSLSPPPWNNRKMLLRCEELAGALNTICDQIRPAAAQPMPPRSRRQQKPRNPSIATLIKRAEKTGKAVTSITTPDGMTLRFGEPQPAAPENPWPLDEFRMKETKQ